MIFRKTLLRELTAAALGTFLVLLGIALTTQLVRLLGEAATGAITSTGVLALIGLGQRGSRGRFGFGGHRSARHRVRGSVRMRRRGRA